MKRIFFSPRPHNGAHCSFSGARPLARGLVAAWLLGLLGLLAPAAARAQTATWQAALAAQQASAFAVTARATAVNAAGDVFVAGFYTGAAVFGSTTLTSVSGSNDLFVAKWNTTTQSWAWAVTGGGTGADQGLGLAVSGTSVYVTGYFTNSASNGNSVSFGGQALNGVSSGASQDMFVAKYVDAGSSATFGWASAGGGGGTDQGYGIAASGTSVYVTGYFANSASNGNSVTFGGQVLNGLGSVAGQDVFVAKYVDAGSSATFGWASAGGGSGTDQGYGIAVSGTSVYLTGYFTNSASNGSGVTFGGQALNGKGNSSSQDVFVAKYVDAGSSATLGWATAGGGGGNDLGYGIAVNGTSLYVTGYFTNSASNTNSTTFGGQALNGLSSSNSQDVFVAKYVDAGSSATFGWATAGGGSSSDVGFAIAADGANVYITGYFTNSASNGNSVSFGGQVLNGLGSVAGQDVFVAKYVDAGSSATFGWAAAGGGGSNNDSGYGIAANSTGVYAAFTPNSVLSSFGAAGTLPNGHIGLGTLNPATGAWQSIVPAAGPSGTSQVRATATNAAGDVFVTGFYSGQIVFGSTTLYTYTSVNDVFVAKWSAASQSWTWAVSGGGSGNDAGYGIAVSGTNVYVTGTFVNTTSNIYSATFGGQPLNGLNTNGAPDVFVAKYVDAGSSATFGWATAGGGGGTDTGYGIAASGTSVYVTGSFTNSASNGNSVSFGGQVLNGLGSVAGQDVFVAKYVDAGSSATFGWAAAGGGSGTDQGYGIAVSGTSVYLTGYFTNSASNGSGVTFGGQVLNGLGSVAGQDVFVAKYVDAGSSATFGWATASGGGSNDIGNGIAANGASVYVTGYFANTSSNANGVTFGGQVLNGASSSNSNDVFVAKYVDAGSSATLGWATAGGGTGTDVGYAIAVSGPSIYVTGSFTNTIANAATASFGGQALLGMSGNLIFDIFAAKYTDAGSSATFGWVAGGGGGLTDYGYGIAVSGPNVYVGGYVALPATFGSTTLAGTNPQVAVLGRLADQLPVLTTAAATAVAGTRATLGGTVTSDAGQSVTERGVVYGTSSTTPPTATASPKVVLGSGTGAFGQAVTGLAASTTYYVRAYALNGAGLNYGAVQSFTTTALSLTTLNPASGLAGTTVVLTGTGFGSGSTVSFGGTAATSVTFTSATQLTAVVPAGASSGDVTVTSAGETSNGRPFTVTAYYAVRPTGFTADVVAEGTATAASVTSVDFDGGGTVLVAAGYSNGSTTTTQGLPATGLLTSVATGVPYQFGPYTGNNSLRLTAGSSGTLTMPAPAVAADGLRLLWSCGNGSHSGIQATVNFSDGTSQVFTGLAAPDWYNNTPFAVKGLGRVIRGTTLASSTIDNDTDNPRLYEASVTFGTANAGKKVSTVQILSSSSSARLNLMAVTLVAAQPVLSTIAPNPSPVGSTLTLTGTGLTGTSQITFGGSANNTVTSGYTVNAAGTQITGIVVPAGAVQGTVTATTPVGTSNAVPFTVLPTISGVSPLSGAPGTTVTITGTGLTGASYVFFAYPTPGPSGNNVQVNASGTSLTFQVPANALSGALTVQVGSGQQASSSQVFVAVPVIQGMANPAGTAGDSRTFTGINFDNASQLLVGGVPATITALSSTSLTFTVPANAASGPGNTAVSLSLTTPGGTVTTSSGNGPTFNVNPRITSYAPNPVTIGSTLTLTGTGFSVGSLANLALGCTYATNLVIVSPTQATVTVPAGACTGAITYSPPNSPAPGTLTIAPTVVGISPSSGVPGDQVIITVTGSNNVPYNQITIAFNGVAATSFYGIGSGDQYNVTVPAGASTGPVTFTNPGGTATGPTFTVLPVNLTVSTGSAASPVSIAAGTYTSITITSTGYGRLAGDVAVAQAFTVQGSLDTNCHVAVGDGSGGSFTLAAGATLSICNADGIVGGFGSFNTGAVQFLGRSYSPDASYIYTGTGPQVTGNGLPAQVRNLTTTNNNAVTLTAPTSVAQALTIGGSGNLVLNGQALTLRSDASGTALVVNSGTGVVSGGTATVQRYLTTTNLGPGYRQYSSPVSGNTMSDLTTAGFTPTFNTAYNNSATSGQTTPFPTVFGYDQGRIATAASSYAGFDKGWFSPAATDAMTTGAGYTVDLPGTQVEDFTGTLNTGIYARSLARGTDAAAGYHLVGNPYPAPLDWSAVVPADRPGLDAAVYVFESSSQYAGMYRAYVNGVGSGNPLIGSSQGFFVRVSQGQPSASLTFRNSQRVTSYADQVPVRRGAADARPQVQLTLAGNGLRDDLYLYAEAGATAGSDAAYDALKLPNSTGLNLAALTATSEALAIQGVPALNATVVPLAVQVPAAGSCTLTAAAVANLPAGTRVELVDQLTGTRTLLATGTAYRFAMSATTAPGRFYLNLTATGALASAAASLEAQVLAYPNPAHGTLTVLRPAGATASGVLYNSLGQVVRTLALPAADTTLDLHGLAPGVYSLRLTLDGQPVTKRIVLN